MSFYKKQDFEAVAVYDYKKESNTQAVVVIEPKYSVVALCFYDSKGNVDLIELWNESNSADTISLLTAEFSDLVNWKASASVIKTALTDFYMTNCVMNSTAFPEGTALSAAALMDLYKRCGGNDLDSAVKSAEALLKEKAIPLTNIKVLFVGEMCEFFPAECIARLCFSPLMPMLPDSRFTVVSDTAAAISAGVELIERRKSKKIVGNIEWVICSVDSNNQLMEHSVLLAEDQTPAEAFSSGVFKDDVVFATHDTQLTVKLDGVKQQIAIPSGFIHITGGVLQLGLKYENEKFSLLLKNNEAVIAVPLNLIVRGE